MEPSRKLGLVAIALVGLAAQACSKPMERSAVFESRVDREDAQLTASAEPFAIRSPAFADGARIDREYTRYGENHVPSLSWSGAPDGTKSFALEVLDPDAPTGTFAHWIVWDIPPGAQTIDGMSAVQGKNDAGRLGWSGPEPPAGSGDHHYVFRLYALDIPKLGLDENAGRAALEVAMQGHVIATTEITGLFGK
jgi:Raf kinase inhibitor-like YbhB/YbcL family protein